MAKPGQLIDQKTRSAVGLRSVIGTLFLLAGLGTVGAFAVLSLPLSTMKKQSLALTDCQATHELQPLSVETWTIADGQQLETLTNGIINTFNGLTAGKTQISAAQLKQRSLLLSEAMQLDPSAARKSILTASQRRQLPARLQPCVEQPMEVTGTVATTILENFSESNVAASHLHQTLTTLRGQHYTLYGENIRLPVNSTEPLTVSGVALGSELLVETSSAAVTDSRIVETTPQNIAESDPNKIQTNPATSETLVLVGNFSNTNYTRPTVAEVESLILGPQFPSVADFLSVNSTGTKQLTGRVMGGISFGDEPDCSLFNNFLLAKRGLEFAISLDPSIISMDFKNLILIGPWGDCLPAGYSTLGYVSLQANGQEFITSIQITKRSTIFDSQTNTIRQNYGLYVLSHELMHGFGLKHAGFYYCNQGSVPVGTNTCDVWEYGDKFDVLGGSFEPGNMSMMRRSLTEFARSQDIFTVDPGVGVTLDLVPLDSFASGYKAIKIRTGTNSSGEELSLVIDYRRSTTYDSLPVNKNGLEGVFIHQNSYALLSDTILIDPSPPSAQRTANMTAGSTYEHPISHYRISVLSMDATKATVRVLPPDVTPPTATILNPLALQTVTGTVPFTVLATDNLTLDHVDYFISPIFPRNLTNIGSVDQGACEDMQPGVSCTYSLTWNSAQIPKNGTYNLEAKAYDEDGNQRTSEPVRVTLSNQVGGSGGPPIVIPFE